MFSKMKAVWAVLQAGKSVANPKAWKAHQITVTMIAGLLIALVQLAKMFGYEIPLDSDAATAIAGGVLAAVNVVLTVVSTDKIGLPATQPTDVVEAAHKGIDEATRKRAEQFVKQQTSNGLQNDA